MKMCEELFVQLKEEIVKELHFSIDETSDSCVFVLPFKDSMGDNFVIRLKEREEYFVLDDAGMTQNMLFMIAETVGGVRAGRLVHGLFSSFGAHSDQAEGVVELKSRYDEVIPKLLHFTKLLLTLDTMLVEIVKEERKAEKPQRQSLGPRASQKLRKSLKPLIKVDKISHRFIVDGLSIPDWMVDFAYKPVFEPLAHTVELVVLITVDLAVLDPILKSAHAFSRAVDIKAMHANYDIRVAFDRHRQNSSSLNAANFLTQHQIGTRAYTAIDISEQPRFGEFVNQINRETGMPLTV